MKKKLQKLPKKLVFLYYKSSFRWRWKRYENCTQCSILCERIFAAKLEAEKAFGDGSLYVEKYLESPRHIEFQILADKHGNMVHLGERDCSVQKAPKSYRRSSIPFLDKSLRNRMGKAAIKAAQAADYINGTIEFLVDAKGNFYFIEMNTAFRLNMRLLKKPLELI